MERFRWRRALTLGASLWLLGACATAPSSSGAATAPRPGGPPPSRVEAPKPPPLPGMFESDDFVVTFAKEGDTPATLAQRFLGDPARAWMIEDYNQISALEPGKEVIIPKRPWNLSGVDPAGYQLVPVLCYHNIGPQAKGRLVIAAKAFEEQMRHLKSQGYRVVSLKTFLEFTAMKHQLPRKSVVLTFDDGWRSFREYAYPILKELGFTATLFIYTDFIGARSALTWEEMKDLDGQGFEVEAHSKTHSDMRRKPGEPEEEFTRRIQAELVQPLTLFLRYLGRSSGILAYPYGSYDDQVQKRVKAAGYVAAFDVRRQGNPSFSPLLSLHRSQIYSEMSLEDFAKNLNVFSQEPVK